MSEEVEISVKQLVPVIDQVLDSINRGQIEVANDQEIRETLLLLRSLALQREGAYEGPMATVTRLKPQEPNPC